MSSENSTELTPLMIQYQSIKDNYKNEVLFFRLGDFYEMFNDDAVEVSRLLNLTLTHRGAQPMCGIPYHASKIYIARLLRLGKKIAICEQVGEIAHGKGLTERKVIEVITPGTAVESEYLDLGTNSYLAALNVVNGIAAFAFIDVTTSEFHATSWKASSMLDGFSKELGRCSPKELILPDSLKKNKDVQTVLESYQTLSVSYYPDWHFSQELSYKRLINQFKTVNLKSFSLTETSPEVSPAGFLLDYLQKTTNTEAPHIEGISVYKESQYVIIDDSSRRNLEIVSNLRDGSVQYTLLECVNHTLTAMGKRMIRSWLLFPLSSSKAVLQRQEKVAFFVEKQNVMDNVRKSLEPVLDIERLASRIAMDRAHAKDLKALSFSLQCWNNTIQLLDDAFDLLDISDARNIINLIESSICDDPATSLTDGRIIKDGWSKELDHWREVQSNFSQILEEYAEEERKKTGIPNLKIKYNNNAGYFIEVTKGKLSQVPSHFIMRRSLVNAERYTTERLQELESELNTAGSKILELERDLFLDIRNRLHSYVPYLLKVAENIGFVDVTASFAYSANLHNWVRPVIDDSLVFDVKDGRHPVVEMHLPSGEFVPNDLSIEAGSSVKKPVFCLITGPNMAGKSTYLRQNALIALLAQTGCYVPASSAHIGIVDRIFCRVGASDNLARGESTFLVEMSETAHILRSATEKSLVIMDEVGRGTSTEDGLSIAWAISEYLLNSIRCKTLFATHYHELTRLSHPALQDLCMEVSETDGSVIFLRKVIKGAAANSYGLHVAKLAGVPSAVVERAQDILNHIQSVDENRDLSQIKTEIEQPENATKNKKPASTPGLFSDEEMILDAILSVDTDNITPMQALKYISSWKNTLSAGANLQ
ncbi:MAG: DNA mismatch repair protein MutS [Treponema sp.]|nr:DNA mismatch repair protein MutS [Treponema sp.]